MINQEQINKAEPLGNHIQVVFWTVVIGVLNMLRFLLQLIKRISGMKYPSKELNKEQVWEQTCEWSWDTRSVKQTAKRNDPSQNTKNERESGGWIRLFSQKYFFFAFSLLTLVAVSAAITIDPKQLILNTVPAEKNSENAVSHGEILLIGLDDLDSEYAQIKSVWGLIYRTRVIQDGEKTVNIVFKEMSFDNTTGLYLLTDGIIQQQLDDITTEYEVNWDGYYLFDSTLLQNVVNSGDEQIQPQTFYKDLCGIAYENIVNGVIFSTDNVDMLMSAGEFNAAFEIENSIGFVMESGGWNSHCEIIGLSGN